MMQIVVLCNDILKEELLSNGMQDGVDVIYISNIHDMQTYPQATAFMDLLFKKDKIRVDILKSLLPKPVIVNSVTDTLADTGVSFVRINAWPTFLKGAIVEGSCLRDDLKEQAVTVCQQFNKTIEWLRDEPGFITPRIVSMIVNEAYFTLAAGVSTKEEIDIAMKLGTNYPYGPFEWSTKIGLKDIVALLRKLSGYQERYRPCSLLLEESGLA